MKEGMQMRWGKELREENCCRHNSCMEEEKRGGIREDADSVVLSICLHA